MKPLHRCKFWQYIAVVLIALSAVACQSLAVPTGTSSDAGSKSVVNAVFSPETRVMLFTRDMGQWVIVRRRDAKPGSEFLYDNKMFRVSDTNKTELVAGIDIAKLYEADRPEDKTSRMPTANDVVLRLDKQNNPVSHEFLKTISAGTQVCFQGRVYNVGAGAKAVATNTLPSVLSSLQKIEITNSSWQHVTSRHTLSGSKNSGASIFYQGENIKALVKFSEIVTPEQEQNSYYSRDYDAGHIVGFDPYRNGMQTTTVKVISTANGQLVTVYPVVLK